MKYCSQCGKLMQDGDRFCMKCGSASGEAGATGSKPVAPASAPAQKPVMSIKSKIIIGALLVILMIAGGFLGWNAFGTEAQVEKKLELAVKYLSDNNYDQAVLAFNDAIKIDPNEAKAYQGLGRTYSMQGKYDQAIAAFNQGIIAVDEINKETLQIGLAGIYIDKGDLVQAEKAFQDIISENPGSLEAYFGLAMVYEQAGDNARAKDVLNRAIDNLPNDYRAYNQMALFLGQNGETDEAFDNLVKSLNLELNQQDAYLILAELFQDDYTRLQAKIEEITNQNTADMLLFYRCYLEKDWQGAVTAYKSTLQADDKNLKARILAATAMVRSTGDTSKGKTTLGKIQDSDLNDALLCDMAEYYLAADDKERARQYAVKALQVNGTNLEAIALLQNLNSSDPDVGLYTASALLFNWKPVVLLKGEMDDKALPYPGQLSKDELFDQITQNSNIKININQIDNQDFPIMKLYVSVLDQNNEAIDNIPLNYFILREKLLDAQKYLPQKIRSVSKLTQNTSLSIDLVMDTSDSMGEDSKLDNAKQAAHNFIQIVNGADEVGILEFNTYVRTKTDFTKNTGELTNVIAQLYNEGQTALYDAMYTALVQTSQKQGAKCVIVFTDGQSNNDTRTQQDVVDLAKQTGIPIYTIGIGDDVNDKILNNISIQTGGYYSATPTTADLENIYKNIYIEQQNQYLITYKTNNPIQSSSWRNLELAVYGAGYAGLCEKEFASEVTKPTLASFDMSQIDKIIKSHITSGDYSIEIKDLSNGFYHKTGDYNQKMPASALINIPITLAIADKIQDGSLSLDTEIIFHHTVNGRGVMTEKDEGEIMTIGEVLQTMLKYSDNNCTNTLLDYLGIDTVNSIVRKYGCMDTVILHPLQYEGNGSENLTTCADVEKMVELLYSDSLPIGSSYMDDNFKIVDETKRLGILKYLPDNIFSLHHNGVTDSLYNETAFIGVGSKKYILTVLSCNGKLEELEETTALISKYVYEQMQK